MNVLMISPGYPPEMPFFTQGLAEVGAKVVGIGDGHAGSLPAMARDALSAYVQVPTLWDERAMIEEVRRINARTGLDRIECLWEPGMILAAKLREALGVPGLTTAQTIPFRDKGRMKEVLDAAGIRTPRHVRASSNSAVLEAIDRIGFPAIVKPIAGAGSADTHRVNDRSELERILPRLGHVAEVSVEEFIEGEEFTFDTICSEGQILYFNMSWYRPPPLIGRSVEWISPQTICLRDVESAHLAPGREMGKAVLRALGFRTGFTHMEWFRKEDGEAVFGEIAARPPGAKSVDIMNFASDISTFTGWAEAVCHGRFSQPLERKYNSAVVFKRAHGSGRIERIEGLGGLLAHFGQEIVAVDLLPLGAQRRNWKQTLLSDGFLICRHPDLETLCEIADRIGTDLQMYAS